MTAAHRELGALRALLDGGQPMTAPIAAALGADDELRALLRSADRENVQAAFAMAVINGHLEAVRLALEAGADVNAYLIVHAHSTALHQAANDNNVRLIELLLAHGARRDLRDTLWSSTPLGWATYFDRRQAMAALGRETSRGRAPSKRP